MLAIFIRAPTMARNHQVRVSGDLSWAKLSFSFSFIFIYLFIEYIYTG